MSVRGKLNFKIFFGNYEVSEDLGIKEKGCKI